MEDDYVRLVISDLHLGSVFSKEEEIYNLLSTTEFDELVLAGDIIDFIKIPSFTKHSAKLFDFAMQIKKPIIYIVGNHDIGFKEFVGQTIGKVRFVDQYDFEYASRKYRIQHGDQYEKGIIHWRFLIKIISIFHDLLERRFKWNLAAWWVKLTKKKHELKRIWHIVKKWNEDADVFIMGHTHTPEAVIWVDKDNNIKTYVNTGDWVEHSTYVLIKGGEVRLKNYKQQ